MPCIQNRFRQGILKGEVSLYHWPPVWLVWNQLYDNWQFYLQNRLIQTNQTGGQQYSDTSLACVYWNGKHSAYIFVNFQIWATRTPCGFWSSFPTVKDSSVGFQSATALSPSSTTSSATRSRRTSSTSPQIFQEKSSPAGQLFLSLNRELLLKGKAQYSWPPH